MTIDINVENQTISQLKVQYDKLGLQLSKLDEENLANRGGENTINGKMQTTVVRMIDVIIHKILTTLPDSQSEKKIYIETWEEHADVIVGAGEGDIFHNLHLELALFAA